MTFGRLLPLGLALSTACGVSLACGVSIACGVGWAAAASAPGVSGLDRLFAPEDGTRAVLVVRDGVEMARRYAPGFDDTTRFISWSMAKTVTAMLVGELVADGRLALDAPAPIPEWQGDARRAITLRQLLQMSSGLRHIEVGERVQNSDTNQVLFVSGTQAMAAAAIARPLAARPGTVFNYDSLTSIILAEIVTRTLTASTDPRERARAYTAFAEQRLFAPAGIRSAALEFDGAGTQIGGSLIYMTLEDWGRFGEVLVDGRGAGGQPIVAPEWLSFMKTPSPLNGQYGGQTWLNRPGQGDPVLFGGKGAPTIAAAVGHLGQYVLADRRPDGHSLVIVRLGKTPDGTRPLVMDRIGDFFVGGGKENAR